jgi:NADH-quinone oxidoreductase subunit J
MFSRRVMDATETQANHLWWLSLPLTLVLFIMLLVVVNSVEWPVSETAPTGDTVLQLGLAFLGSYLIPFEVVGILLSAALVGAIILAREKTKEEAK